MSSRKLNCRDYFAGGLIRFALALLCFIVPVTARTQVPTLPTQTTVAQTLPISLDEAVRAAESQSEAIRIARAGVQRAQGQQYQARSQRYPQLNGSAGYTRTLASQFSSAGGSAPAIDTTKPPAPPSPCDQYLLGPTATDAQRLAGLEDASRCALGSNPFSSFGSLGFGAKNQYNLGLSLSQNLFAGGRIQAQNAVANAGRRSAEIELAAQRAQLRLDVTQDYFDAALADRLVALAESSAVQTENVLKQTQLARTVGNVSEFELLRAQVSSANQRPIVIQRQIQRGPARRDGGRVCRRLQEIGLDRHLLEPTQARHHDSGAARALRPASHRARSPWRSSSRSAEKSQRPIPARDRCARLRRTATTRCVRTAAGSFRLPRRAAPRWRGHEIGYRLAGG